MRKPGKAKHAPNKADMNENVIMSPNLDVLSTPSVSVSNPTSNIVDGIDSEAKDRTKLIEPNMTKIERSPAFAVP